MEYPDTYHTTHRQMHTTHENWKQSARSGVRTHRHTLACVGLCVSVQSDFLIVVGLRLVARVRVALLAHFVRALFSFPFWRSRVRVYCLRALCVLNTIKGAGVEYTTSAQLRTMTCSIIFVCKCLCVCGNLQQRKPACSAVSPVDATSSSLASQSQTSD